MAHSTRDRPGNIRVPLTNTFSTKAHALTNAVLNFFMYGWKRSINLRSEKKNHTTLYSIYFWSFSKVTYKRYSMFCYRYLFRYVTNFINKYPRPNGLVTRCAVHNYFTPIRMSISYVKTMHTNTSNKPFSASNRTICLRVVILKNGYMISWHLICHTDPHEWLILHYKMLFDYQDMSPPQSLLIVSLDPRFLTIGTHRYNCENTSTKMTEFVTNFINWKPKHNLIRRMFDRIWSGDCVIYTVLQFFQSYCVNCPIWQTGAIIWCCWLNSLTTANQIAQIGSYEKWGIHAPGWKGCLAREISSYKPSNVWQNDVISDYINKIKVRIEISI